jgi:hypothetical protein
MPQLYLMLLRCVSALFVALCFAAQAAYSLPRWLKPETASNRVWLRSGQLHIIPPPSDKAPHPPAAPTVAEALAVLASGVVETRRKK